MKKLHAYMLIAWAGLVHIWRRVWGALLAPWRPLEPGFARFLANYRADGITPLGAGFSGQLPSFQQCIACGLCDAHCPIVQGGPRAGFPGPSYLPKTVSRNPIAAVHARGYLAVFDTCGTCRRCEEVCPHSVPIRALAASLAEYARRNGQV